MKNIILMVFVLTYTYVEAQKNHPTISGKVIVQKENKSEPVAGAFVHWEGIPSGVFTDDKGQFIIDHYSNKKLIASFASYNADTISIDQHNTQYTLTLRESNELKTTVVIVKKLTYGLSKLSPRTTVLLGEREFQKAACCNLSESFENAPAIDVSFSDAVMGTKQIKMLGLDGFYTLIGREYMPAVRTLNAYYGLSHIPAAWVDGIQITKGAGSVVNGFESIAGQINIELKKPFGHEKFLFDHFISTGGRYESDLMYTKDINQHVATSFFARYGTRNMQFDRNNDGFLDMPLNEDFKVMNRWQFYSENGLEGTANVSYHKNHQDAGQAAFFNNQPTTFGIHVDNEVFDAFAKMGKPIKKRELTSLGSQFNFNQSSLTSRYGSKEDPKQYVAQTNQGYVNLLYESYIKTSFHQFQTGISLLIDETQETYEGFRFERTEMVPGVFFEYTYQPKETFSLVGGVRTDYNTIYGLSFTPRIHSKYRFNKEKTSIRISAGTGRRTSNPLAQNQMLFASGRTIGFIMQDSTLAYGLEQEVAINSGISIEHEFRLTYIPTTLSIDYFNTTFIHEVVLDRENNGEAFFYNVNNGTRANSFQAQLDLTPARRTDIRIAYRLFDVSTKYQNKANRTELITLQKPFISKHRAFVNLTQKTRTDWQLSTTATWYGPQRIPGQSIIPTDQATTIENNSSKFSPNFVLINAQISKTFKKEIEFYMGAENMLNYRQENPIQNALNPFENTFDAGLVWGPIFGRMFYGGIRWRIKTH